MKIGKKLVFDTHASKGQILKALGSLEPGNPESYLVVDIGGKIYDSIQAIRNPSGSYHVEILRCSGGRKDVFSGKTIFACEDLSIESAVRLFVAMLAKRDAMKLPEGAAEITTAAAANRYE